MEIKFIASILGLCESAVGIVGRVAREMIRSGKN
jgi:hypothetical protein